MNPDQLTSPGQTPASRTVLRVNDTDRQAIDRFFSARGLLTCLVERASMIPGSHWGDDEAGLIKHSIYFRLDTPLHSLMHEACHWFLMDRDRREGLHTDAGGTSLEECAVCFLQIILAHHLPPMDRDRMFADMDSWGYSFRTGSSLSWFETDADDALDFLRQHPICRQDELIGDAVHSESQSRMSVLRYETVPES